LLSEAKEDVKSFSFWFRKKYNLAPTDKRFLDMTQEGFRKEFLLEQVDKNPEFSVQDFEKDDSISNEEWMKQQEIENTDELLKQVFEGKLKPEVKEKEGKKIMASGLSPVEMARNKVKVSMKSKFEPIALGGINEEFEEVFRETNS